MRFTPAFLARNGEGNATAPPLRRAISRPMLVLYGVGTILGAGIYALVGEVADAAGRLAPLSFVVAALIAGLTAASFAELTSRYPEAAGEASFVAAGFPEIRVAAAIAGALVAASGVVSAGVMVRAFTGYAQQLAAFPEQAGIVALTLAIGGLAAWGIRQTAAAVAAITCLEAGALLVIVVLGLGAAPAAPAPTAEDGGVAGVMSGAVLAFYAFIGFEDLVNVAEEVKRPRKSLPFAIFAALAASAVLYLLVTWTAVRTTPLDVLAGSEAPMTAVVAHISDWPTHWITATAMLAVINGALVQVVMASRVLYGLARKALIAPWLARVSATTRTPLHATALVTALVLACALALPIEALAQATTFCLLVVFALVNAALIRLKGRGPAPPRTFEVPLAAPWLGAATAAAFAALALTELVT